MARTPLPPVKWRKVTEDDEPFVQWWARRRAQEGRRPLGAFDSRAQDWFVLGAIVGAAWIVVLWAIARLTGCAAGCS